jgi:hypothetical protein
MPEPTPNPDLAQDRAHFLAELPAAEHELASAQAGMDAQRTRDAAIGDKLNTQYESESAALHELKPPAAPTLPTHESKPVIDPKEFQSFGMALIGLAMLGGAKSRGNWLGVSSTLNGAMQGYIEGNQQRADQALKEYQTQFNAAMADHKNKVEEYRETLNDRKATINETLIRMSQLGAKHGDEPVRLAAAQKRYDDLWKHLDSMDLAGEKIASQNERVQANIELALKKLELTTGGAAMLSPQGMKWVEDSLHLGSLDFYKSVQSRFGGRRAADIINDMAAKGQDPGDIIAGRASLKAYESAARVTELRRVGIERLTGTVQDMEKKILTLAEKVVPSGMPAVNATVNMLQKQMGSGDFAKFRTEIMATTRLYIEAVTMPGSLAQLHATQAEVADSILNPNMSVEQIIGTFQGMNEEIAAGGKAIGATSKRLHDLIAGRGMTLAVGKHIGWGDKSADPPKENSSNSAERKDVPLTNAKGWPLHKDKNGTEFYLAPDGVNYEVVQ